MLVHSSQVWTPISTMEVDEIIGAIDSLDWDHVGQHLRGRVFELCYATEEDWNEFGESELDDHSKTGWIDGKIVIVELPPNQHEISSRTLFTHITLLVRTYVAMARRTWTISVGTNLMRAWPDSSTGRNSAASLD